MKRAPTTTLLLLLIVFVAELFLVGCAKGPFFRPQGTSVASCSGVMKLDSGGRVRFTVDLYKDRYDEMLLYLSIPSKDVRYSRIKDIDFEDDILRIETESSRVYKGSIKGNDLKLKGEWGQFEGAFTFKLND